MFVEEFTSRKEYGLQQDFYSTLIADNFITCACGSIWADMPLKKHKLHKRRLKYRINRGNASRALYECVTKWLLSAGRRRTNILRKAEEKVSEILSPVRKGRRFLHNSHAAMHSTCHCRAVLSLWHWFKTPLIVRFLYLGEAYKLFYALSLTTLSDQNL